MKRTELQLSLKLVTNSDGKFLFDLLKERDSRANISHKKMPTYVEHIKFIKSKPYSKWYIIYNKTKQIGSIYLSKQNEIGIHLLKKYEKESTHIESIKKLMLLNPKIKFRVNISPKNKNYIIFFKKLGFEMIQHTYELDLRTNF